MPRSRNTDADVDTPNEELEETATEGTEANGQAAKGGKKKEPARGDLPEGVVTPVGFAKILGERGLQKDRQGNVLTEVRPQMVYSYIKNAPKEDPFPLKKVNDSIGKERDVVSVDEGVAWWERKNTRTAERAENARKKEAQKAANKAKREQEAKEKAESAEAEGTAEEAE
jgi:hypothetical protein